ncbi:magnesium/cobalt transporter CorA [Nannocystis pusilla]|uniref:Magnesium transport protein CorA n=1 Tax=Nannocystis pusilla TaxID=889268 RepID=A0ABS7TZH1_9BACT|nr:magnesium/cobalt transporter CorA [Nannocystis pusilla]
MFTLHAFHPTRGHWNETDLATIPGLLAAPDVTIWLDLQDPTEDEARVLSEVFHFHPLAIEDMLHDYGHPKLDVYDDYVFLIVHGIDFHSLDLIDNFVVNTLELDIFAGPRYVVTHHAENTLRSVSELHRDVCDPCHRPWISVRVLHRLLDRLVDNYLPVMDKIGARLDALEDLIIHRPEPEHLELVLDAKKVINRLRRITGHQRLILESLARGHIDLIPRDSIAFFRDIYDHFVRVADLSEANREGVQAAVEAYLSVSANKTNEIMKVLTQISTVMLPLTFIAGIYGMNFDIMPELRWSFGYPFALGLMALTAAGLIFWFRRRHWL